MGIGSRVLSAAQLRRARVLGQLLWPEGRDWRNWWHDVVRPTLGYLTPARRGHGLPRWVSDEAVKRAHLRHRFRRRPPRVTGILAIDERLAPLTSGYNASILETRAVVSDWVGRRESHPFLDPRFVKATYGLDPWWPTKDGHYRALEVSAFGDRLPAAVAERRSKADFSEVFWPQVLSDFRHGQVRAGPLHQQGWLDLEGFDVLLADAKRGMANAAIPLFRCLSLDDWMRMQ
jgi:hypothetical protein